MSENNRFIEDSIKLYCEKCSYCLCKQKCTHSKYSSSKDHQWFCCCHYLKNPIGHSLRYIPLMCCQVCRKVEIKNLGSQYSSFFNRAICSSCHDHVNIEIKNRQFEFLSQAHDFYRDTHK